MSSVNTTYDAPVPAGQGDRARRLLGTAAILHVVVALGQAL